MDEVYAVLIFFGVFILFFILFFRFVPVMLWITAFASGVKVSLFELLGMRFRLIPPEKIVYPMIKAVKAGLDVDILQLETHYLSGGNVARVVDALIVAKKNGIELSFEQAAAFDLEVGQGELDLTQLREKRG